MYEYHSHSDIVADFKQWENQHPNLCRYTEIGTSVDGLKIPCIIVGNGNEKVLMEGGVHGDEWSGTEMVYLWAQYLLENQTDYLVSQILDGTKQYCLPISNPDGHKMMTRKNSHGVDCNRNWDFHWGGCGTSSDPNSPIYKGPSAFSEPETQAYQSLCNSNNFKRAVSYHSGVELLMYPWGWTYDKCPDDSYFRGLCQTIEDATRDAGETPYTWGQISTESGEPISYPTLEAMQRDIDEMMACFSNQKIVKIDEKTLTIYCAAGTSVDWYYGVKDTEALVLEVSYRKTPDPPYIPEYFNRTLPMQIVIAFDAMNGGVDPGPIDDTKNVTIRVM